MAPEIVGVDTDGWPMRLSEYRGKVVLLSFWATWCGPCMRLIPHERELAERLDGKLFAIVGVNGDTDEKAPMAAVAAHNITWRSFRNIRTNQPAIEEEWRVQGWPELYLIDQEGVVRERWLDWDEQTLDEINKAIDHVLGPAP
jgi:thiol-disulfide isomerase/thioredoxin